MRLWNASRIVLTAALAAASIGCSGKSRTKQEMTVLLRMMPAQERHFRENIVKPFEKEHKCKINIATFTNQWDIERMLKLEAGKKNPEIGLVKTPFEMTRVLAGKGYMKKLSEAVDSAQVVMDMAEYHPLAAGLGYIDGVAYYIPRKLETRVLFYRKSKVADAVEKFPSHKERIDAELKKANGHGLPTGYELESDPGQWDFYDLYTVGAVWAAEEYNGVQMGRMAHRGARYEGTATFLVDRAYQLGANKEDILRLTSDEVAEMFLWENVLIRNGIYNPGMWQDPWKGANLYNGIKDGKVFMAYFQQIDCFIVHGWDDDPGMPSFLPEPDDMGLAIAPKAVSFTIGKEGKPAWEGDRNLTVGGWWWGIPKTSPTPGLAYEFARYITNKENQANEIAKFGMIPVRKDILNNLPELFDQGWVGEIFQVSVNQIELQLDSNELVTVPLVKEYSNIAQNYIEAWYRLCVEYDAAKEGSMDLSTMKMRLASDFLDKQKEILAEAYPEN